MDVYRQASNFGKKKRRYNFQNGRHMPFFTVFKAYLALSLESSDAEEPNHDQWKCIDKLQSLAKKSIATIFKMATTGLYLPFLRYIWLYLRNRMSQRRQSRLTEGYQQAANFSCKICHYNFHNGHTKP